MYNEKNIKFMRRIADGIDIGFDTMARTMVIQIYGSAYTKIDIPMYDENAAVLSSFVRDVRKHYRSFTGPTA